MNNLEIYKTQYPFTNSLLTQKKQAIYKDFYSGFNLVQADPQDLPVTDDARKKYVTFSSKSVRRSVAVGGILSLGISSAILLQKGRLYKIIEFLNNKIKTINTKESFSKVDGIVKRILQGGLSVVTSFINIATNLFAAKDVFITGMFKKAGTKVHKVLTKLTGFFMYLAERTTNNNLKKNHKQFNRVKGAAHKLISVLKKDGVSGVDRLEADAATHMEKIGSNIDGFIQSTINKRNTTIKPELDKIAENFAQSYINQGKGFINQSGDIIDKTKGAVRHAGGVIKTNLDNLPDLHSHDLKIRYKRELFDEKCLISRSLEDNRIRATDLYKQAISELRKNYLLDRELKKDFNKIFKQLDEYTLSGNNSRKDIIEEIGKLTATLNAKINKKLGGDTEKFGKIKAHTAKALDWLNEDIDGDKKGQFQHFRELFKPYSNELKEKHPDLYWRFNYEANSLERTLNNGVVFEAENALERMRDLKFGAAPVEIFGLVSSVPVLIGAIAHAKTEEEKKNVSVKLGIPVVGGALTWVYASVIRLFAGSSALMFSVGSAVALSFIADKLSDRIKPPPDPKKREKEIIENAKKAAVSEFCNQRPLHNSIF